MEGVFAYGQVLEALENLTGPGVLALRNLSRLCDGLLLWMCCRGDETPSENIPLLSEQNGFLNSAKKVTSSVTQLSPLVRLLSSVVTPSVSTDLRMGTT